MWMLMRMRGGPFGPVVRVMAQPSDRISGVVQCLPPEAEGLGADASVILEVIRVEGAVLKRESNVRRLLYGPRTWGSSR